MKIYPASLEQSRKEPRRRIAIFGGRFDPVHNGHLAVAREVLRVQAADEVWLSLENQHQWRPIVASVADRKAMLELAIEETNAPYSSSEARLAARLARIQSSRHSEQGEESQSWIPDQVGDDKNMHANNKKIKMDTTPITLGGLTETISVVRALRKKYPQHEFIFVVGSDNMNIFHKWTHWRELEKEVHFLVVARKGSPVENVPKNATVIADPTYVPLEDSATEIRRRIKAGESIHGLVPNTVEKYIIEKGLYK